MEILEDVILKQYVTLRAGGPARYFSHIRSLDDLKQALHFAEEKDLRSFILGGGSNILVSDRGFDGLVLKMENRGISVSGEKQGSTLVTAQAGTDWDAFVAWAVRRGFWGLENLSYIPGTVGAAPVQNIGAYGTQVAESIESVAVIDAASGTESTLRRDELGFAYRDSIFKHKEGRDLIITSVTFALQKAGEAKSDYAGLTEYLHQKNIHTPSMREMREAVIATRQKKLPSIHDIGTAGSFFKNPIIDRALLEEIERHWGNVPHFSTEDANQVKIPAAWLLDHVGGWKGYREDHVGVHDKHALVLIHDGDGLAEEIDGLARRMQADIEARTGVVLEREPVKVGW
jgi:UDP-N-acetylmuramate dehydrogenase